MNNIRRDRTALFLVLAFQRWGYLKPARVPVLLATRGNLSAAGGSCSSPARCWQSSPAFALVRDSLCCSWSSATGSDQRPDRQIEGRSRLPAVRHLLNRSVPGAKLLPLGIAKTGPVLAVPPPPGSLVPGAGLPLSLLASRHGIRPLAWPPARGLLPAPCCPPAAELPSTWC